MDCFMFPQTLVEFKMSTNDMSFSESISLPLSNNVTYREIANQIIRSHKLPVFVENEVTEKLKYFIDEQTDLMHSKKCENLSQQTGDNLFYCKLINFVNEKNINDHQNGDKTKESSDKFYNMYHELIHSGILTEPLMKFENFYSISILDLISSRDRAYHDLVIKQTKEMETAIKNIETTYGEDYINSLSVTHFEELEKMRDDWNKIIKNLKKEQKKEFHEWICKVYEDYKNGNPEMIETRLRTLSMNSSEKINSMNYNDNDWNINSNVSNNRMEESFTINLGAQLKTTHNLRLISMDILSFCRMTSIGEDYLSLCHTPQRIQTSMSLYSNSLSALVLLVDNRINSYSGIKLDFSNICSSTTEFHFDELEKQMDDAKKVAEKHYFDKNARKTFVTLKTGDFYITKHSNLSEVHVVFHLVCDDSLRSSDINSRHPVILGLRNILKISHLYDINTITIPLLLIQEMTEEITIQWCIKRAELVLKCVKGFMIELASFLSNHNENRTVQFVVPKGISHELFSSLTTILPSIFRLSNTLNLRSN